MRRMCSPCCARAASGYAKAAPPSAASNSRRPRVTVIRPSRARCVKEGYHAASVLSLTARHPAWAESLDFKRFIFGRAVRRVLINAGIGRMSARGGEPDPPGWRDITPRKFDQRR